MEATKLIGALASLRVGFDTPPSDMELIRRAVQSQVDRATQPEMPPLLNADQRKLFAERIDEVTAFLECEDGADAVELLMGAWARFLADREAAAAAPEVQLDNLVE